jgi:hypothetical protein
LGKETLGLCGELLGEFFHHRDAESAEIMELLQSSRKRGINKAQGWRNPGLELVNAFSVLRS